jgi:hypothetical protein
MKPKWNARSGAEELYSTFKKIDLKLEDFQGRRFIRLNQLTGLMTEGNLDDNLRWTADKSSNISKDA